MKEKLFFLILVFKIFASSACILENIILDECILQDEMSQNVEKHGGCSSLTIENVSGAFDTLKLFYIPPAITELKISNSNISYIPSGGLCMAPNLRKMAIEDNYIFPTIDQRFLENCRRITKLELSNVNLDPSAFLSVPSLEVLNLKKMKIRRLDDNYIRPLNNLKLLRIEESEISQIRPAGLLCSPSNLKRLHLINNQIFPNLTAQLFDNCENLEGLVLSGINYPFLDQDAFRSMDNLVILDITGLKMKHISSDHFRYLYKLRLLHLVENGIEEVDGNAFSNLVNLEMLNLKYSDLEEIQPGTFEHLRSLEVLCLAGNKLKNLDNLGNLQSLKKLDVSWNLIEVVNVDKLKKDLVCLNEMVFYGNSMPCLDKKNFILEMKYFGHQTDVKGFFNRAEEDSC